MLECFPSDIIGLEFVEGNTRLGVIMLSTDKLNSGPIIGEFIEISSFNINVDGAFCLLPSIIDLYDD